MGNTSSSNSDPDFDPKTGPTEEQKAAKRNKRLAAQRLVATNNNPTAPQPQVMGRAPTAQEIAAINAKSNGTGDINAGGPGNNSNSNSNDFADTSLPSCSWHDMTVPLGSLVNSMVMAQRNFSEALCQVQSEDQPLVMLSKMTHFDMPTIRALQHVFTKIGDHDGKDNLISVQELCHASGIPLDSLLGKALFRLFDITRSNNINFRTWVLMLSKLSPGASIEEKVAFAFNVYDNDGDGFIERPELVAMLRSVIPDLSETDTHSLIESLFAVADKDGDKRIDLDDYRSLVVNSQAFYDAFTIDIQTILRQHYNIISQEEIKHRIDKLQERDMRQDERANRQDNQEVEFMTREHEDVQTVNNLDDLDI